MSFADFPEQKSVVRLLQQSLEKGRLGHAYLFTGDNLSELEQIARTLAKTLNCQQPLRSSETEAAIDCCDQCDACRRIDHYNHPDVQWVRPESKLRVITIDQMRDLMQTVHMKALEAPFKVAGIVAADRLNTQAANAFLKTLEEPPPRSVIILLSTEPQRMLETIVSRCLRLNFAGGGNLRMSEEDRAWISEFASSAAQAGKGILPRYRLLSVLLNRLNAARESIETQLAAQSPLEKYEDADAKLREKWEVELSAAIEAEYRHRRAGLLGILQWWMRDVWLKTLSPNSESVFPELESSSRVVAGRVNPQQALENLEILEGTQRLLGSNVQEALALEVSLLKLRF